MADENTGLPVEGETLAEIFVKLTALQEAFKALLDDVAKIVAENRELNDLFELQHDRANTATAAWRIETGKQKTLPDLGKLLAWLLAKAAVGEEALRLCAEGKLTRIGFEDSRELFAAIKTYREVVEEQSK